jgi:Flp pilus assembly protein TadG
MAALSVRHSFRQRGHLKKRGGESGAELIEFAVVFPLLLLVVLGIIDFGFLFQRYQVVTNAAREGARVSILPGYAAEDVEARVDQYLTAGGLTAALATTTVGAPQQLPVGGSGQCITVRPVTVSYPHEFSFVGGISGLFGAGFTNASLQATSTMRNEFAGGACP